MFITKNKYFSLVSISFKCDEDILLVSYNDIVYIIYI